MSETENASASSKRGVLFYLLPLILFLGLASLFFIQLLSGKDISQVPSALIGKPVPTFDLPALEGSGKPGFDTEKTAEAQLTLINVWASWCGPCRAEHPFVTALGNDDRFKVFGLNYKDNATSANQFLTDLGNNYDAIGVDVSGRVGIDFGVYGVPETFLVDNKGTIVYKFIGPITQSRLQSELLPAIEKALAN